MNHRIVAFIAVVLAIALAGCGAVTHIAETSSSPATGNWTETLLAPSGQQMGTFTFSMTQNSAMFTGSGMNFTNMPLNFAQCFGAGTLMTGQMNGGGMNGGMMNGGSMTMTMSWTMPGTTLTNTLTMQGTMSSGMGSATGTFNLVGQTPGCNSQSGSFTMSRMM